MLKKTRFKGYVFMRPYELKGDFVWIGFDESGVTSHGTIDGYNSLKGETVKK